MTCKHCGKSEGEHYCYAGFPPDRYSPGAPGEAPQAEYRQIVDVKRDPATNLPLDYMENEDPYCDVAFADQGTSTMINGVKVYTPQSLASRAIHERITGRILKSNVTYIAALPEKP